MSTGYKTTGIERSDSGPRILPTLASMPNEIKDNIVYWVHINDQETSSTEGVDCPGLDTQSESSDVEEIPCNNALSSSQTISDRLHVWPLSSIAARIPSSIHFNILSGIKSLCLVDHTFYEYCRPWLWRVLHFKGRYETKKLEQFSTDVIPKHSNFVRSFRWKMWSNIDVASLYELEKYEPDTDPIFLGMLKTFEKLEKLEIQFNHSFDPKNFFVPVSKHKSLVSLSLLSGGRYHEIFQEDFLVSLLTELNLLQSFTCSGVVATEDKEPSLGLCLSKMKYLSALHLEDADCVNLSWSNLNWTGQIEKLTLKYCNKATIEVLYHLTKCFASTLYELDTAFLILVKRSRRLRLLNHPDEGSQDFGNKEYNFNLPRLHILHLFIDYLKFPLTRFVKSFTSDCKELMELNIGLGQSPSKHQAELNSALGISPLITKEFLEESIRDKAWPKLQKIEVGNFGWSFAHIQSLGAMGINLIYKGGVLNVWGDFIEDHGPDDDDDSV